MDQNLLLPILVLSIFSFGKFHTLPPDFENILHCLKNITNIMLELLSSKIKDG